MRDEKGRFVKGFRPSKETEFKKGQFSGNKHPKWKGGFQKANGYLMIHKPNHPYANKKGYLYYHRYVVEKSIGRYLNKKESVHHKNRNKLDNRIENLQLFSSLKEHMSCHKENGDFVKVIIPKEELLFKRFSMGMTLKEISKDYGCHLATISRRLKTVNV